MSQIERVDVVGCALDVARDSEVAARRYRPGPPIRIDGLTLGIVSVNQDAPHGGEVHPDGDEILYVISGRLRVLGESDPAHPVDLGPGEACIVRRGEWHRVILLEPAQLLHLTPGPHGDYRPLPPK